MRVLISTKVLRRYPPLLRRYPPLLRRDYWSSSTHCLFTLSPQPQPQPQHQHHHNPRRSPLLQPHLPNSFSFSRQFSTQPDDAFLPVRSLISLLDSYHLLTGFPWWITISSATVAMRLALFPLIVLQRKKMKRIGELLPKLPPPFPPPLSGRSYRDQISLFMKEKQSAGCPSILWFFSSFAIQVPCFFLWIMSVRRMSLAHHPGFDCGGALWFQNLTEYPNGVLGPIFPLFIAGLHFTNVQMSFKPSLHELPDTLGLLGKWYKRYMQLLTLPILFTAFNVPQGSLVYWLTNSSLTVIQQICLNHPGIVEYFGLAKNATSVVSPANKERGTPGTPDTVVLAKQGKVSAQSLSPAELVSFSIKVLTDGRVDTALKLLRLALDKDPGHARALLTIGQTLLQIKQLAEATEYLETAVSKLTVAGHPTEVEEVDLLILSSLWAGIANVRQGKMEQGLVHLERIARLEEPDDPKSKAHYYELLFVLSSVLLNMERKAEASKYLHRAAAYDPSYNAYLKDLENDPPEYSPSHGGSTRKDR